MEFLGRGMSFKNTTLTISVSSTTHNQAISVFNKISTTVTGTNITGFILGSANVDGTKIYVYNSGSKYFTLKHQNSGSTSTNRFSISNGLDLNVYPNELIEFTYNGTNGYWITEVIGSNHSSPSHISGRLTLTTNVPVTTSDVTNASTIYFTPYKGNIIWLYDGVRWVSLNFPQISIPATQSQSGTTTMLSPVITGLTDTSQLARGMTVTGTNTGIGAVISSIDSATQITVSVDSIMSGSDTITFKVPSSKNIDIFGVLVNGSLALRYSNNWTSDTARSDALATLDGVKVNNAVINSGDYNSIAANAGLYLGSFRTVNAGETIDSGYQRYLYNEHNKVFKYFYVNEPANSWTYTTPTWRQANANTANKIEILNGFVSEIIFVKAQTFALNSLDAGHRVGIGENSTSAIATNCITGHNGNADAAPMISTLHTVPPLGYVYYAWLEYSNASATTTWYGDNGTSGVNVSGLSGQWAC